MRIIEGVGELIQMSLLVRYLGLFFKDGHLRVKLYGGRYRNNY